MPSLSDILDKAKELLKGEPARAIGYGAAAIIYLVAYAFDAIPDMTPDAALLAATGAIATLATVIESIRSLVTPVAKPDLAAIAKASVDK